MLSLISLVVVPTDENSLTDAEAGVWRARRYSVQATVQPRVGFRVSGVGAWRFVGVGFRGWSLLVQLECDC